MLYLAAAVIALGLLCSLVVLAAFATDLYRYERDIRARRRSQACKRVRLGLVETNRRGCPR